MTPGMPIWVGAETFMSGLKVLKIIWFIFMQKTSVFSRVKMSAER